MTYDVDGDGPIPPAEVVTTAPHPFFVSDYDRFIPAAELRPGDTLVLADGRDADVVSLSVEFAGTADEAFTTYNFEVADFHTYFVAQDGVWVHNAGGTECERIMSLFRNVMKRYTPDDPMAAYKYVRDKLPRMSEVAHRGVVDDVLKEIKDMNAAGTLNERWRTLGMDAATGRFKEGEVFAAHRFESKTGRRLRRPQGTESGDFVELNGIQWDVKGPLPSAGNFDGFLSSIRTHIRNHPNGDEKLIIDLAGLNTTQAQRVEELLATYKPYYELLKE